MREIFCRGGLGILVLLSARPLGATGSGTASLRIGKITVRSENVFSPRETTSRLYRAMDRAHVATRPSVIRRFLLFKEGDAYDPRKLEETERNLRDLGFLKSASVSAGPPHDGLVDVLVATQDSWSLLPGVPIASNGGTTTYGVQLLEGNLLGTGRELSFSYNKEIDRITRVLEFFDPYLFGSYWSGRFSQAWNSDGRRTRAEVIHPFVSLSSPRSNAFGLDVFGQTTRTYADGAVNAAYQQDHRGVTLEAGWALATSGTEAHRLTAGLDFIEDRFGTLPGRPNDPLPDSRTYHTVYVGYELARNDLLKLNYVNRDLRFEDFNLGWSLAARLGFAAHALGSAGNSGSVRFEARKGTRLGAGGFVLARAVVRDAAGRRDPERDRLGVARRRLEAPDAPPPDDRGEAPLRPGLASRPRRPVRRGRTRRPPGLPSLLVRGRQADHREPRAARRSSARRCSICSRRASCSSSTRASPSRKARRSDRRDSRRTSASGSGCRSAARRRATFTGSTLPRRWTVTRGGAAAS